VRIQAVADAQVRADRLAAGEVDMAAISTEHLADLEPLVWGVYEGYDDVEPTVVHPTGTLRLYRDLPWPNQRALLFCYDINPEANPYIGSGALDGQGIPPDFFQDLHVRRAVNHLMDWSRVISEAYGGEAIRSLGPIPAGMLGYDAAQPSYAYNLTLAAAELQQAWGGAVWSQGLSMTLAYREDDVVSQAVVETLAENLGALNPAFHVGVVGLSRNDLLAYTRTRRLPVYPGGWMEDYHHPHEWVWPFLHSRGFYAEYQSFPPDLTAILDGLIEGCAALLDPGAAQVCYEAIQNTAYTSAAAAFGVQRLTRSYVRTEVQGYLYNPARPTYPVYYLLSKRTWVYLPLVVRRW
jgi:peptide/nickel transport system substrate-binding protein